MKTPARFLPLVIAACVLTLPGARAAQPPAPPPTVQGLGEGFHGFESALDPTMQAADPAALADFSARRYGLFIHWGPVTLAGTELGWSRGDQVPVAEYDQLYRQSQPQNPTHSEMGGSRPCHPRAEDESHSA